MIKSRFALILAAGAAMQFAPLSQPASAADLPGGSLKDTPYVVVPSWQGLYFGGHAGGVWGNTNVHDHFDYVGDPEFNGNLGSTGFIGGAQAGYNIQRGHFVFGPEADIGYLGISASKSNSNTRLLHAELQRWSRRTYDPHKRSRTTRPSGTVRGGREIFHLQRFVWRSDRPPRLRDRSNALLCEGRRCTSERRFQVKLFRPN